MIFSQSIFQEKRDNQRKQEEWAELISLLQRIANALESRLTSLPNLALTPSDTSTPPIYQNLSTINYKPSIFNLDDNFECLSGDPNMARSHYSG